ncbi:hypothetical protein AURDEDRAFT_125425 [Auricularia subglabra TFB-10046 SS5]|nr:hypothetical protein AURDEDRAFT_125425 [Auricularia subglabra TFB-10046 SS5]
MPSLRRVVSQPSIRPAPYSIQQGLPPPSPSPPSRTQPRPLKRRPSTVQSGRVVLGEIEWWRVMRGQEPEPEDDRDTEPDTDGNGDADGDSAPEATSPEDELIANAVRLAISNASQELSNPPEPALALTGENGPAGAVPATPPAVRAAVVPSALWKSQLKPVPLPSPAPHPHPRPDTPLLIF